MTPAQVVVRAIDELIAENDRLKRELAAAKSLPKNNAKKLSKREVAKIRELSRLGAKNVDIAYGYDIHPATVSRIVRRQYHK